MFQSLLNISILISIVIFLTGCTPAQKQVSPNQQDKEYQSDETEQKSEPIPVNPPHS